MSRPASSPRSSPRLVAALVALCLLLSGIAPGVSRALAAAQAAVSHDVCTADGERPALPAGHHGGGADEPACPLCTVHGGTHAAPVAPVAAFVRSPAAACIPVRVEPPCAARGGWFGAAPRGPPAAVRSA